VVSKKALQLLIWMDCRNAEWLYAMQIQKELGDWVDTMLLDSLYTDGYIERYLSPDELPVENEYDMPAYEYRISDKGVALLEAIPKERLDRWYPKIISTVALVVSIIALVKSFFFT
jgi:hypothetical protein